MKINDLYRERAPKHTDKMEKLYSSEIKKCILSTRVYGCNFKRKDKVGTSAQFFLEKSYSQDSVLKHAEGKKLAVLNFASYRRPGGGFLRGATTQEEALCHASFLYNVISSIPNFYEWNKANYNMGLYKNRALYSPGVYFFIDDSDKYVTADVLTCAAPNRTAMLKEKQFVSEKENESSLRERIRFLRDICDAEGVDTFVAGAFGCGVFSQNPETVARLFIEFFSDTKVKQVIFAIPPGSNYDAFARVLKQQAR